MKNPALVHRSLTAFVVLALLTVLFSPVSAVSDLQAASSSASKRLVKKLRAQIATLQAQVSALNQQLLTALEPAPFLEMVTVGQPGNSADPEDGDEVVDGVQNLGSVAESFQIGKHEITNAQFAAFLNAVAKTDTNALYHSGMGIKQFGTSGQFAYAPKPGMGDKPVVHVTFLGACRFVNWLHNGMPSGNQDATTTEDGAYDLTNTAAITNNTLARKPGARYFLPSENEWYKVAFFQPTSEGGDADGYWGYTARTNSAPAIATADVIGNISNTGGPVENHDFGADWDGQDGNVTTVGSGGPGNASHYGAFDLGGNVFEWTETVIVDQTRNGRKFRGGDWKSGENGLRNEYWSWAPLNQSFNNGGFRVAGVGL